MKLSIAHLCIFTRDLEQTEAFYCKGLGMKKVFEFMRKGSLYGFYLEMSEGNFIEVFLSDDFETKTTGPMRHLCLETDDIEAAKEKLTLEGIETTSITKGCDNTYQFWFKDPNGIDIELHQYTDQSSQFTGVSCEVDWV